VIALGPPALTQRAGSDLQAQAPKPSPGQQGPAGDTSLIRSIKADIPAGRSQAYTVQARPGDLVIGPLSVQRGALVVEVYDPQQKKIKASWFGRGTEKAGFVAPIAGRYRVTLIAQGDAPVSFTWGTTVTSPAARMAGRHIESPIVSYPSARIQQLEKDVAAKVPGALARFWQEAVARGGPIVETLPRPAGAAANASVADEDVLVTLLWRQIYDT
jgi:hypothetical protein